MGVAGDAAERRGDRLGDRAAEARPQGVHIGVFEGGRPLAIPHRVAEHQRAGAVAVVVSGGAPRVEPQL